MGERYKLGKLMKNEGADVSFWGRGRLSSFRVLAVAVTDHWSLEKRD